MESTLSPFIIELSLILMSFFGDSVLWKLYALKLWFWRCY